MTALTDSLKDNLDEYRDRILADPPELPDFDPMELSSSAVYATRDYTIAGKRETIEFYAETEYYPEGFYAFIPAPIEYAVELQDGDTFGGMGGFRIYLPGE